MSVGIDLLQKMSLPKMSKEILKALFPEEAALIEKGQCPFCKKNIDLEDEFKDNSLGVQEYLISGLCNDCQKKTFNVK